MNTNKGVAGGVVGVLSVLDDEIASLPTMAEMASNGGIKCDPTDAIERLTQARATVQAIAALPAKWRAEAGQCTNGLPIMDAARSVLTGCAKELDRAFHGSGPATGGDDPAPLSLREELQGKCSDWGTYWRAADAHGVILSVEQATELLRDALAVEVEIKTDAATPAGGGDLPELPEPFRWVDVTDQAGAVVGTRDVYTSLQVSRYGLRCIASAPARVGDGCWIGTITDEAGGAIDWRGGVASIYRDFPPGTRLHAMAAAPTQQNHGSDSE